MVGPQPSLFETGLPMHPPRRARAPKRVDAVVVAGEDSRSASQRVLDAIKKQPGTAEQIANRINEPLLNVRPRCSDLVRRGLIRDSGRRGTSMGGQLATVWEALP